MLPEVILQKLKKTLSAKKLNVQLNRGGDINQSVVITTPTGERYFLKWNDATRFPKMFEKEARGLDLLRAMNTFKVPKVVQLMKVKGYAFLMLEMIDSNVSGIDFWEEFGMRLAALHRNSRTHFGLEESNYIGSLEQFNHSEEKAWTFFRTQRLEPQINYAKEKNLLSVDDLKQFDELFKKLPNIIPDEAPALIHGDLWSGNFLIGREGEPVLIDPAVAYAPREMDIAMTSLFGGFEDAFYESYNDILPFEPGIEERLGLWNLYYLLVHLNLFGSNYLPSIQHNLKHFVG